MTPEEFSKFRHEAVHALMRLNESCDREFSIPSLPQWYYDLEAATLTFSEGGTARVVASIQVVGTTSTRGGTWLWSWANRSLPASATEAMKKVRSFGEAEKLSQLTDQSIPGDDYLGWAMTAIAATVLGSKGAYRCPGDHGFIYFTYTDISFANVPRVRAPKKHIECSTHGAANETFVCEHILSNPAQQWFSEKPDEDNKWPDSWCAACEEAFQQQGEWNDKNNQKLNIKLLCNYCYENLRSKDPTT
jgi:hypothetical protein